VELLQALERLRSRGFAVAELSVTSLRKVALLAITSFPHAILPNKLLQEFQALSEVEDRDIQAALRENFGAYVQFFRETLEEGKARGLVRHDVDCRIAAWHFTAIGFAFDLIHLLDMDRELDHGKVEDWGKLYLESIREKPRGTVGPEGPLADRGTVSLWESPRQGLP